MFDLTGKVALITGGSRGLGLQIAEAYLDAGASVVLTAHKQYELDEAKAHLSGLNATNADKVKVIAIDLQKLEEIPAMVSAIRAELGEIDILVNNAGTSWGAPMEDHPLDAWHKVMNLNMTAPFVLTQEVGKQSMIPRQQGKIINIASIGGLGGNRPEMNMATISYNASKGAMVNFTRALACEWGKYNINVNALCPGFFITKLSEKLLEGMSDQLATVPLGRFGNETDLKGPAIFFASEASRHVTGSCLAVDGGVTSTT